MSALLPHAPLLQQGFLAILPRIETHARICFRQVPCPGRRAECVAETLAIAWRWYVRLTQRGKDVTQFVSVLASRCAQAVRNGRRLTGIEKAKDVMSPLCQLRRGIRVECFPASVSRCHEEIYGTVRGQQLMDGYEEMLCDNTRSQPDEAAAFRIDFTEWRLQQTERDRRMIDAMASGERTLGLARKFAVSPARISQKRREFMEDWDRFHGELTSAA